MQHFMRNTVSASCWCARCSKMTQHRIDGVKRGPCLACVDKLALDIEESRRRETEKHEMAARQASLF